MEDRCSRGGTTYLDEEGEEITEEEYRIKQTMNNARLPDGQGAMPVCPPIKLKEEDNASSSSDDRSENTVGGEG